MTTKNLLLIGTLAAGTAFGQLKLPNLNSVKDKLANKNTTAAKPAEAAPAGATAKAPEAKISVPEPGPVQGKLEGQPFELTLCEKPAKDPSSRWDVMCTKPATTFAYKGSVTNFFGTMKFTPALTNESVRMKIIVYKNDVMDEYREITFQTGGKTAGFAMTKAPGLYTLQVVDQYDSDKVGLTTQFLVSPDTVGDRAVDNIKSGIGKLMVCSSIDDNWKCLDESTTWAANKPFNLYVRLPEVISGQVAGWAIFKQNPDGTDGQFVEDMLQGTQGRAAYWATTGGHRLPAGTYTIYSIVWAHRATIGNLTSYFAKTTLTVK
jgi:hypothetical protein